jgi:transposase
MRAKQLLASMPEIRILKTFKDKDGDLVMKAAGSGLRSCPDCQTPSTFRKGGYVRQLQDLPVQGIAVRLEVRMTRWRCRNEQCARQSFVERLENSAPSHARRTRRVSELARVLGHATGGLAAERLLYHLGVPQSDDTVLRIVKRGVARRTTPLRVAGIDDWSWQQGRSYGTIVVDLERREVVDVLGERSAEATARWLLQHPEMEIVSRDRCGLYAEGARRGAPQARQVADRFHLLQNLRETIERQLSRSYPQASVSAQLEITAIDIETIPNSNSHGRQPELLRHRLLARQGRRTVWLLQFDRVKTLRREGKSFGAISKETGLNWRTVAKWARLKELPERRSMSPKSTTPRKYESYLTQRWAEGFRTGRHLLPEIQKLGYTGSLTHLERLLSHWRRVPRGPSLQAISADEGGGASLASLKVLPKAASYLCMKPRGLMLEQEKEKVDELKQMAPAFAAMRQLAMRFRGILQGRDPAKLDSWLDDAMRTDQACTDCEDSPIPFATTLPLSGMPLASVGATDKLRVRSIGSKPSNDKCMAALEPNCYALDSFLCSATSSPQIEEDPFKRMRPPQFGI